MLRPSSVCVVATFPGNKTVPGKAATTRTEDGHK